MSGLGGLRGLSGLEGADRRARDQLRRSAAQRKELQELVRSSCLSELAKLGRAADLELPVFAFGVVELLAQFLPLRAAILVIDVPQAGPLEVRAGRGGPPVGARVERDLAEGDAVLGRITLECAGEALDPDFVGAVAAEVAGRLTVLLERERLRRRTEAAEEYPALVLQPAMPHVHPAVDVADPGTAEVHALHLLAGSEPLATRLEAVAQLGAASVAGATAILLVDTHGTLLRLGASAGLLREHALVLDGLALSPTGGPTGRALWSGRREVGHRGAHATCPEDLVAAELGATRTWAMPVAAGANGRATAVVLLWTSPDRDAAVASDVDAVLRKLVALVAIALQRERDASELVRHTTHDRLTGLANRVQILDRVASAIARSDRMLSSVAVLVLDLDRFKMVNDSLGHELGDRLLVALAARLRRAMRPGDVVGRLGADEFVVVCEDVGGDFQAVDIARQLSEVVGQPFSIGGRDVYLTSSIGIAVTSGRGPGAHDESEVTEAAATLLRDADAAMARAKAAGTNRWELFDQATRERLLQRLEIHNGLRRALDAGELGVLYQPEVEIATGRLVGVEALVRWHHPHLGTVTPDAFIPAAEESGLIIPVGTQVLEFACREAARWEAESGLPLTVWVNLSGRQLLQPDLPDLVGSTIAAAGLRPSSIGLEITESALMEDAEAARSHLQALRALGVGLAIDDFGTGYSSLAYLKRFTVDRLKVDRSFVSGIEDDADDAGIVAAIVQLAMVLGLDVVAEGVEDEGQAEALARLGCTLAQGYLFARPQPADAISRMLTNGRCCVPAA